MALGLEPRCAMLETKFFHRSPDTQVGREWNLKVWRQQARVEAFVSIASSASLTDRSHIGNRFKYSACQQMKALSQGYTVRLPVLVCRSAYHCLAFETLDGDITSL